ncbi:MAG TPA: dihydrolipoamide acetyltransferase family protein [Actinomycetota bacterium]|nr:dihydrolipoamide acetyltransferase family protein [Actinomycetota bacterium]
MAGRVFALPDLGEGLEEATITAWLVKEGDPVSLNQPIVEVETVKATVEIPSPFAGTIARLHGHVGETVNVGAPLVTFDVENDAGAADEDVRAADEDAGPAAVPATPAVRRRARELGVELGGIAGSGPGGRITHEDVEGAARSGTPVAGEVSVPAAEGQASPGEGMAPAVEPEQRAGARALWTMMMPTDAEVRPISTIRRTIAENLTRVVREVPQVTTFRTLDSTALEAFRGEAGLSPLPIVVRALADVCKDHRSLNASYLAEQGEIWLHRRVHVGIATDTERGLLVPVVRDVGDRTLGEVAAEIQRLASAARDGSIRIEEMTGGTITVTNTGSYGSEFGTPIINRAQAAILGLGAIAPRALVVDGQVVARPACTLSLTFDHRLLDGATAGRAFGDLVATLSSPDRLEALPR